MTDLERVRIVIKYRASVYKAERKNMTKTLKKKIKSFSWKKIQWKKVLSAALAVLLLVGAVAGIATLAGKKTKTISSFAFDRGTINANGEFEKSDTSIYTEDMFECQGLTIEPDFKASGTYQVFYYAVDKTFIGATDVINANDGIYNKGDTFEFAKYARILITPDASAYTDEGEEFKIRFYEVTGYASDYTVTVNKKQTYVYGENLFKIDPAMDGKYWYGLSDNPDFTPVADVMDSASAFVDCSQYSRLLVYAPYVDPNFNFGYVTFGNNLDNYKMATERYEGGTSANDYVLTEIEIPQGATRFVINYRQSIKGSVFVFGVK